MSQFPPPVYHLVLTVPLCSQDVTLKETVLDILSDYYKNCDHSSDARIAVLELIEQVNTN